MEHNDGQTRCCRAIGAGPDDGARDGTDTVAAGLGQRQQCNEIEGPMTIVILCGMVTSTLLNLAVLPTLALRYGRLDYEVVQTK